ncbi:hypothetical protein [Streptomyces sp. NPDC096311]|uniref:hypothetical protein n=1 Tax=Streptomyces sp. NPDC096311 TaxID=3366083 RepID=UPI003805DDED
MASQVPSGLTASASTFARLEIFSAKFGTAANTGSVETVSHGVAKAGQPTVLNRADCSTANFTHP